MITQAELKKYLLYDPTTGQFTWLKRDSDVFNARHAGKAAGFVQKINNARVSYTMVHLNGKRYSAHRLVWVYMYDRLPSEIDHINGIGTDNRLSNLREVSRVENMRNRPKQLNNKSGVTGVSFHKSSGKWAVTISDNVQRHLGLFADFFEAVCVRKSAENSLQYHLNHGRN